MIDRESYIRPLDDRYNGRRDISMILIAHIQCTIGRLCFPLATARLATIMIHGE